MDFKKLKKATNLLEKVEIIDKEIIEIDKMALSILNNETKIEFDLKVENISKNKDDEIKVTIDEDGSLSIRKDMEEMMQRSIFRFSFMGSQEESKKEKKNSISISKKINDKIALQILGVILCEKNFERESLIKQLNRLGVS